MKTITNFRLKNAIHRAMKDSSIMYTPVGSRNVYLRNRFDDEEKSHQCPNNTNSIV